MPGVPGTTFDTAAWAGHAQVMIEDWLSDFTWRGQPLAAWIETVVVQFDNRPPLTVWRTASRQAEVPLAQVGPGLGPIEAARYNMWHAAWPDLVASWHLAGRWLHPETDYQIDQLCFAENRASLFVGCLDRNDLTAPRRYDPARDPVLHDMGVIAFPLRPHRALRHRWDGHTPELAMLLCVGTAVAESVVHESFETFQNEPGHPALDPHDTSVDIRITVAWNGPGRLRTDGWVTRLS